MKRRSLISFFLLGLLLLAITFPFIWLKVSYEPLSGILKAIPNHDRGIAFWRGLLPLIGVGMAIYALAWLYKKVAFFQKITSKIERTYKGVRNWSLFAPLLFLFFASLIFVTGPKSMNVLMMVGIYMILALGLNVTIGMTGLLVLGYAGFFSLGGYTFAILQMNFPGFPWWMALPIAGFIGALVGWIVGLPCLRLKGDYLAIVTLGFAESFREFIRNIPSLTKGDEGIVIQSASKVRSIFGLSERSTLYLWIVIAVFLSVIVLHRLYYSSLGRAWTAIRENEIAAEAMGVSVVKLKLFAFSISAFFAAIAGVFYTVHIGFLDPQSCAFETSVLVLAMVILGGLGSIPGALLGSMLLYYIPTLLRDYFPSIADYRLLLFGGIMVIMMLVRPQGLMGSKDRL